MKLIIFLILLSTLASCKETSYSLIVVNRSNEKIHDTKVWYGNNFVSNGGISQGDSVTILSHKTKLTENMKMTWVDVKNKSHEQTFKTFDFIPEKYDKGNVIFSYVGGDKFILEFYMPKNDFSKLIK